MGNTLHRRAVTRIREEFTPMPQVQTALNRFLERPNPAVKLHTTAQKVVNLREFHNGDYAVNVTNAEKRLKALGERVLALQPSVQILKEGRRLKLLFDVDRPDSLQEMTDALDEIPTLEAPADTNMLCIELAKEALVSSLKLRQASEELLTELRDPTAPHCMKVIGPKIVTKDIPLYSYSSEARMFLPNE